MKEELQNKNLHLCINEKGITCEMKYMHKQGGSNTIFNTN
jgi:hypothetical protein